MEGSAFKRGAKMAEEFLELKNLRFTAINFQWFLKDIFSENSFDTILLNFPDPWPRTNTIKIELSKLIFWKIFFES